MFHFKSSFLSMLSMEKTFCSCELLLILFIVCQVQLGHTQKNASCFSFIQTEKTSTLTLEETCFEISNNKANLMYTGIYLYMGNSSSSCTYHNIQLEEIKKYIILENHQRPLCRTMMTISLKTKQCSETIAKFQHLCQQPKSIYFQECFPVNCPRTMENNIYETEAISMSGFSKPKMGSIGQGVYEIPASHCNMKQCKLDNCSTEELKKKMSKNYTAKPSTNKTEPMRQLECMLIVIGGAGGGLLTGILSTSILCLIVNRCKRNHRNVGDVSFSTKSVQLTEMERKLSIHSKEGEPVYHDISNIPGHSKATAIVHSVSNVLFDDQPEQRYSESPKSSLSTYENGSISSQLSTKNAERRSKESGNGEKSQAYHTLHRDYKDNSRNLDVPICSTGVERDTESYMKTETAFDTKSAAYESPVQVSHIKRIQTDKAEAIDLFDDRVEKLQEENAPSEVLSQVYHTLQKEEESFDAEKMVACTGSDQEIHDQSNDSNSADSQKEYYVISATTERKNSLTDS